MSEVRVRCPVVTTPEGMKHHQGNKGIHHAKYYYLMTIFLHSKTYVVVTGREAAALQDVTQRVEIQLNVLP